MRSNSEDPDLNFRTAFFIILFSIFVLSSSDIQGNNNSSSPRVHVQSELVTGVAANRHSAVLFSHIRVPDIQKFCEFTSRHTNLNSNSFADKILDYNRKSAQDFILIQKTMLSSKPVLQRRLHYNYPSGKDEIPPVLS